MLKKIVSFIRSKLLPEGNAASKKTEKVKKQSPLVSERITDKETEKNSSPSLTPEKSNRQKKYRRPKSKKPSKPKWDISKFDVVPVEGEKRFHDFDLPLSVMHAIADLDFKYCTPVQTQTLDGTLAGSDAIGQAQTGTGKTAAFLISILSVVLDPKKTPQGKRKTGAPRALILAPTRELVMQIAKDGQELSTYCNVSVVSVFGGMDYEKQQQAIERRPVDIIAATPGRLLDFQRRKIVDLSRVEVLVIDEADRMLDMGFIPDVTKIVRSTPHKDKRQTLMFSATLTPEVKRLASQWCEKPVHVEIAPDQVAVDTIEQIVYLTTAQEKYYVLYNMITSQKLERVLVFTNRKDETRKLTERLMRNQVSCAMLSGDVAQKKRMTTLENFRNGKIKVLVATDVAGRGIHIDGISHVFNYTLPYEPEDYVHRIGRTGRAGNAGISISFADEEGAFYLPEIEKYIGRKLECIVPMEDLVIPAPRGSAPKESSPPRPHHKKNYKPRKKWDSRKKRT